MKELISKHKFLKAAIALLIAVALVSLPTTVLATNTDVNNAKIITSTHNRDDALLDEGFEDGVMPPEGWTLNSEEPDVTWQITEDPVYSGDYAAYCPMADPPYDQNEWLISPEIDCTYAQDINLQFWARTLSFAADWTVYLKIRNQTSNWVMLWDCVEEEQWAPTEWHNKTFNLDEYSGDIIQIAWQFVGIDSRDFWLDQIQLFAGEIPPPAELELAVKKIGIAAVNADILNIATDERAVAENVEWTMNLTGPGVLKRLEWNDTGIIDEIPAEDLASIGMNGIFGLSFNMNLTITAECTMDPRVNTISESFKVIIFGIFIIVMG